MVTQYKVKLPVFEGPFDLLLYLIRKNEVDVYDIPIAEITRQYLEYLELMKLLDLDIAGEFIEMVATLILIKVRMLLPGGELEMQEDMEDPRLKLVNQLLEYQQFKEISGEMRVLESERKKIHPAAPPKYEKKDAADEGLFIDASLFDLLTAFRIALDNMPKVTVHRVSIIKVTIEEQVKNIFDRLRNKKYVLFREITAQLKSRMEVVVSFMALLDLMHLNFIVAKQPNVFGEIRIIPQKELQMKFYLDQRNQELLHRTPADG